MKQLVVLMLAAVMAVPALADVAVTAADLGGGKLEITVTPSGGAAVRGVALVLENANGATVASTSAVTATGLNTFIDYGFSVPTGFDVGVGHAAAKWNAAGVAVFPADSAKFAVCAGYLAPSGQLGLTTASKFNVQYTLSGNATIGISLDTLRGGIVGDNIGTITVQPTQVLVGAVAETITGTPVVGKPTNDGFVNGGRVETFVASGVAGSLGGALEYQFTWGDSTTSAWGPATQTKTYTYAAAGTYNVTVKARLQANPAVESAVSAAKVVAREAYKSTATAYATWVQFGRPACWGYQRNCRGDVNSLAGGIGVNRVWVNSADLNLLAAAYNKVEAQLAAVTNGICADFNRLAGGIGVNRVWVNSADLNILATYYNKTEASVPVCGLGNLHFYTN